MFRGFISRFIFIFLFLWVSWVIAGGISNGVRNIGSWCGIEWWMVEDARNFFSMRLAVSASGETRRTCVYTFDGVTQHRIA